MLTQLRQSLSSRLWARAARTTRGRVGLALVGVVVAVALIGPLFAPYSPTALLGAPFASPGPGHMLGLEYVGRDTLSRVLYGGVRILPLAAVATAIGVALGAFFGISAGFRGGAYDEIVMRTLDVLLAVPQIILALLLISLAGASPFLVGTAVVLIHTPQVARVARASTLRAAQEDYVKYGQALGDPPVRIMITDVLPNVSGPLLVETALRLTYSIGIIASLNFLGLGTRPPFPDWGSMINENRIGIVQNPWPVVVPVTLVAVLTIGASLYADALARVTAGSDLPGADARGGDRKDRGRDV
jgi:peptide/nickel transport system permease protein